jgi:hypothetical protein
MALSLSVQAVQRVDWDPFEPQSPRPDGVLPSATPGLIPMVVTITVGDPLDYSAGFNLGSADFYAQVNASLVIARCGRIRAALGFAITDSGDVPKPFVAFFTPSTDKLRFYKLVAGVHTEITDADLAIGDKVWCVLYVDTNG